MTLNEPSSIIIKLDSVATQVALDLERSIIQPVREKGFGKGMVAPIRWTVGYKLTIAMIIMGKLQFASLWFDSFVV